MQAFVPVTSPLTAATGGGVEGVPVKARSALALAALAVPLLPAPALAAPPVPVPASALAPDPSPVAGEPVHSSFALDGKRLPDPEYRPSVGRRQAADTPAVGTVREWLGLDDTTGSFYRKNYTLRGVGKHIEVWVATDTSFPAGDCRTATTTVTDAQVSGLIGQFETVIHPKETAAFSTPPDRDGTDPTFEGDFTGAGNRTVTLVDNVRDDNYYKFPQVATYTAGFFSAQLNELFDRNVMTIDAYDWVHRSGANPPDEATGDMCTSRPARPWMYEATFAHEWQHLLEYYADPDEVPWVNEGLSDYAQTLAGYVNARRTVWQRGNDTHVICFQGFGTVRTRYNTTPRDCGGPQNSLNLWNEGAPADVLADYGNAYQFMLYLHDRFGAGTLERLHRDRAHQGLDGVAAALPAGTAVYDAVHDFQVATLVDKITDRGASLKTTVNLVNPAAYDTPGAAPNGADYVRLRDARGRYLTGADLRSVVFDGAKTLPPLPLEWTSAAGTLFSGNRSSTDATAVIAVPVPAADPTLRFTSSYGAEDGYDFGYVTVSADGGRTYTPVAGDRTVQGPLGPGINGSTQNAFVAHAYDLSAYAGRKVLIGFRYVTDNGVNQGGWSIKTITVGGAAVSSDIDDYRSPTQVVPAAVHGFHVVLAGLSGKAAEVLPPERFRRLAAFPKVVAIVSYDEPTEQITQYAPYSLTVNGVRQPG
jgi:hypothetical protein